MTLPAQFQQRWESFRERAAQVDYCASLRDDESDGFTIYQIYLNRQPSRFTSVNFEKMMREADEWLVREFEERRPTVKSA